MKYQLLPLAAAAALLSAGAAHAQSVTIYGVVDAALEHLSNVGTDSHSDNRMPNLAGSVPSRLGLRGSEDLGGGLSAIFTIEQGFGIDSGSLNQGGRTWGRQAFVGLQGTWGQASFGRQYSMLFWSLLDADTLGPNLFGSGSLDNYLPNDRLDNSLSYKGTFNGLTVGATYSLGRDTVSASSPSGTGCAGEDGTAACREWSVLVKYDTATWGVAAANDQFHGGAGSWAAAGLTSADKTDRRTTLNGWVKFNDVKLSAGVIDRRNEGSATTPRSKLWFVGGAYPVTPHFTVDGEFFKLKYQDSDNGAKLFALRGTYSLSKRTAVYATAGHIANDGTLALSVSNGDPAGEVKPGAGESQNGYAVGLRHSF